MWAGGKWSEQDKILPGAYINFVSEKEAEEKNSKSQPFDTEMNQKGVTVVILNGFVKEVNEYGTTIIIQ